MSLKAKIEAVIYAAEEPVTLAQLVSLLSHEAQAELDHLAAAQHTLPLESDFPGETSVLPNEDSDTGAALDPQPQTADDNTPIPADLDPAPEPPVSASAPDDKQLAREAKDRERAVREYFRRLLDDLIRDYSTGDRGLEIREVANGFRLATKPEYHDAVRGFAKSLKPPLKLSLQALETLAVVAYKQPVTAPEISEIRGVDSGGVLGSLMARKLVTTAGRKQVIGRPILYKTTKDFLVRFGLKDIGELPGIEEFEKMAGELAETDAIQEEIPMPDPNGSQEEITDANLREEAEATEPQPDGDESDLSAIPVDGRISGISPASDDDSVDTSRQEAEVQEQQAAEERSESSE